VGTMYVGHNNEKQAMQNKIIDLTQFLNDKITVYPDTAPPSFEVTNTVEKDGYSEHRILMLSHTGTHIDAPCHILHKAKSLDHFPMDKFIGKAIVIPCQGKSEISREYLLTFESKIAEVDFVLFFTGWQYRWNTKSYFADCPIPTREAAIWLTRFKLKGIGFDAFSVDKITSASTVTEETMPNHHIFLGKEILLIENLTNLDKLSDRVFSFQCFPLKVENADGSPVRAIAMVDE
jgi:arylformamidase